MKIILPVFLLCASYCCAGQGALDLPISGNYKGITFIEMLLDLEKNYPLKFYYEPQYLPYYKIDYSFTEVPLFSVMQKMLPENGLVCVSQGTKGVIICKKTDLKKEYLLDLVARWDSNTVALPDFLRPDERSIDCGSGAPVAGQKASITGRLIDEQSLEPLAGALVQGPVGIGAISNNLGEFSLKLEPGVVDFRIMYPGFRELILHLNVISSGKFDISLQQRLENLQEVVIQGNQAANKMTVNATGLDALPTSTIKELPAFMGEADVIKSLSILPGISTVGEGAAGFNVRGGNIDQNLVLLDGLPLFNTSHVLGLFSVFNPDLIGTTTLYKGHIPAHFGGRSASVLDVQTRAPNYQSWHGSAGIGLSNAKLTLDGPLWRNKIALLAGTRLSFSDWMLKQARLPKVKESSARYGDVSGKIAFRTNKQGSFELSGLHSSDYFRYASDFGYRWANTGFSGILRQAVGEQLFFSLQSSAGRIENVYFDPAGSDGFELHSGLEHLRSTAQLSFVGWKKHEIRTGLEWTRHVLLPQERKPFGTTSAILPLQSMQNRGDEYALFLEDDWSINSRISLNAGLRYSQYRQLGPARVFQYENDFPGLATEITDTTDYSSGTTAYQAGGAAPRIAVNVRLDEDQSLKFSYNRTRQYIHLISNTTAATPADIWQVSNRYIPPQIGDNFGLGYFRNFQDKAWESSLEIFYKNTANLPGYRDFAQLLLNDHLETELISGKGRSYGLECSLKANQRRFSGWLSYTWSRAWQQARSPQAQYSINNGHWFPANFDQPHQLNLYVKLSVNPAHYWTFNFNYRQGRPVSAPLSGFSTGNTVVPLYPERNNLRIPDYHRLDIAYTIDRNKSRLDGLRWTLSFSVYNAYARKNPFAVYFQRDKRGIPKAYQLSTIGTAIPSVNLTFWL